MKLGMTRLGVTLILELSLHRKSRSPAHSTPTNFHSHCGHDLLAEDFATPNTPHVYRIVMSIYIGFTWPYASVMVIPRLIRYVGFLDHGPNPYPTMSTKLSTRRTPRALSVTVQGTIILSSYVTYVKVLHFDHWITLNVWTSGVGGCHLT